MCSLTSGSPLFTIVSIVSLSALTPHNLLVPYFNCQYILTNTLSSPHSRHASIHQEAPEFVDMSIDQEILVTGIKVVDLLAPYAKGGKIGEQQRREVSFGLERGGRQALSEMVILL